MGILRAVLIAILLQTQAPADSKTSIDALGRPIKVILVGASTIAEQTGWGGAFCDLHVLESVACLPIGRGGRSTKTYRADKSWQLVLNELKTPGYADSFVLIEFGHNDKNADPAIGTQRGTEFPANLSQFVTDVRAMHAKPVLVTPLSSRHFLDGQLADSLAPWAAQVREVAARLAVPLLDLNAVSEQAFNKLGALGTLQLEKQPATALELAAARIGTTLPARVPRANITDTLNPGLRHADYIHLNARGAQLVAALAAQQLRRAVPQLQGYIIP